MNLYPMLMEPVYKQTVWGGNRLRDNYNKRPAPPGTGESWELSDVPGSETLVANGSHKGLSLSSLAQEDKTAFWGSRCADAPFPMLVKLIDAADDLSVQVHPSDADAVLSLGERGKAEMWYVLDTRDNACLYLGFSRRSDEQTLRRCCEKGSVLSLLNRVPVSRGDVFFIQPGTIHAIGKGVTLAEIQQSSDTTFRIYDYLRPGSDGKPRELHWAQAMKVIDYAPLIPDRCRANSLVHFPDFTLSELFSSRYFRSYKLSVSGLVKLSCDGSSFRNLLCVEGSGQIHYQGEYYPIGKGQSYFLPAAMGNYQLSGSCTVLLSWV